MPMILFKQQKTHSGIEQCKIEQLVKHTVMDWQNNVPPGIGLDVRLDSGLSVQMLCKTVMQSHHGKAC